MSDTGSRRLLTVVASIAFSLAAGSVQAQTRAETLRYVTGASVNTLDPEYSGVDPRSLCGEPEHL